MYKKADKEVLLRLQKEYLNDTEQYKEKLAEYNAKLTDEQKEALTALKTVEKKNKERRVMKKVRNTDKLNLVFYIDTNSHVVYFADNERNK